MEKPNQIVRVYGISRQSCPEEYDQAYIPGEVKIKAPTQGALVLYFAGITRLIMRPLRKEIIVEEIIYWTESLLYNDTQIAPLSDKLNSRKGLSFDEQSELKILLTMNGKMLARLAEAIRTKNNEPPPRKKLFRR